MGESSGARSALHQTPFERAPLRTDTATSAEKRESSLSLSFGALAISYQPREPLGSTTPLTQQCLLLRLGFLSNLRL